MMTFRFVYYFSINSEHKSVCYTIKGIIKNEFICSKSCVLITKRFIIQIIIVFVSNDTHPFIQRIKGEGDCF